MEDTFGTIIHGAALLTAVWVWFGWARKLWRWQRKYYG